MSSQPRVHRWLSVWVRHHSRRRWHHLAASVVSAFSGSSSDFDSSSDSPSLLSSLKIRAVTRQGFGHPFDFPFIKSDVPDHFDAQRIRLG